MFISIEKFTLICWGLIVTLVGCNSVAQPQVNTIKTENLIPKPIEITLKDLPPPYASESASNSPKVIPVPKNFNLQVPAGFQVNVFADNLPSVRWMTLTPDGDVLAVQSKKHKITLLRDNDHNGVAEVRQTFGDRRNNLDQPLGVTFAGGAFYVANTGEVLRFNYQPGQSKLEGTGTEITKLTPGGYNQHWTRNIVASPDGQRLYVSVGSQSNVEPEALPRASIQVMNLDGSERSTYAFGLRNPVGLDFHPVTGKLYAAVNERDLLGDDLVPDYFTQVKQHGFYGWPYAYLSPKLLDPRRLRGDNSERPELAAKTITPDVLFQAHSAALGVQFYDQEQFPEKYHNGAFVAFRGSWNRDRGTGYKIVYVPFGQDNRPLGYYEDFLTGFLADGRGDAIAYAKRYPLGNPLGLGGHMRLKPLSHALKGISAGVSFRTPSDKRPVQEVDPETPTTLARPVGLQVMTDGSLLLAEDGNNRIYRISYQEAKP